MKIGLVGYQGSGKSTLFEWLTGQKPDPALAHAGQSTLTPIPDPRVDALAKVYAPKKITLAALEIVDTPGLARDHVGNAQRLAVIREAGCLVLVVAGFAGAKPEEDLRSFEEDLLLADLELIAGRCERLRQSIKKARPTRDQEQAELNALEPLVAALESGTPLREMSMTEEQRRAIRAFRLLTEKPKLVVVNTADDVPGDEKPVQVREEEWRVTIPVGLELELARMDPAEREAFRQEMGLPATNVRDELLRTLVAVSRHILFFTAGEKEVRSWLLRRGGTAVEAADGIHSDLARGFIRAETMRWEDLVRLGSEREVKAQHLMRQEPKDYVVQDGDVLLIRFSV